MKIKFNIELLKSETISELPNAWSSENYRDLLELMEYGDTSDILEGDLKEMCLMSLSEYDPDEAAKYVLSYIFEGRLNSGQIHNLSHEMQDEKMWEEYADLFLHEEFFNVGQLLYQAFNGKFPHPEALKFSILVSAKDVEDLEIFDTNLEMNLIELLVQGMPDSTLISRLFKDELQSGQLTQAKDIIWQVHKKEARGNSLSFDILSSTYWFHDLKYAETFECELVTRRESL
jgi:hypothetical protein